MTPAEYAAVETGYNVLTRGLDQASSQSAWLDLIASLRPLRRGHEEPPCSRTKPVSASRNVEVVDFSGLCGRVALTAILGNR